MAEEIRQGASTPRAAAPSYSARPGGSCCRGDTIFLHVLDWPKDTLTLPAIGPKIKSARALTGGDVTWKQSDAGIEVSVPKEKRDPIDTIIEFKLDGSAAEIKPIKTHPDSAASGNRSALAGPE